MTRELLSALQDEATRHGLVLRGSFAPVAEDRVPGLATGVPARALALFGNAGSSLWPAFAASPEFTDGRPDPLDRWSRRVGEGVARRFGGRALYPFGGPPHHAFLAWSRKAEGLVASPVGMLMHPDYGLWHAYRFALALPEPLGVPAARIDRLPCDDCSDTPCLDACPAGAFAKGEYRVQRCVAWLSANADGDCWSRGCAPRRACPVGQDYRYRPEQARFHMRAFVANHRAICAAFAPEQPAAGGED